MTSQGRTVLSVVTRVVAVASGVAGAALGVYSIALVYAAATFEHDSLPGPVVLSMVAVAVGLAAIFFGGLSHVLLRVSRRQRGSAPPHR